MIERGFHTCGTFFVAPIVRFLPDICDLQQQLRVLTVHVLPNILLLYYAFYKGAYDEHMRAPQSLRVEVWT